MNWLIKGARLLGGDPTDLLVRDGRETVVEGYNCGGDYPGGRPPGKPPTQPPDTGGGPSAESLTVFDMTGGAVGPGLLLAVRQWSGLADRLGRRFGWTRSEESLAA